MNLAEFLEKSEMPEDRVSNLNKNFKDLMNRKGSDIRVSIYKVIKKEDYYFHLIIPSETDRDNTYDVVIEFSSSTNNTSSISDYDVRLFSNCPAFAYTYANAYKTKSLLVECLSHKFGNTVIKNTAITRNATGAMGYDKYLYYGIRFIIIKDLMNKMAINNMSQLFIRGNFVNKIRNLNTILKETNKAKGYKPKSPIKKFTKKIKSTSSTSGANIIKSKSNISKVDTINKSSHKVKSKSIKRIKKK